MLLEDHQLSLVDWTDLPRGIRIGTGGGCRVLGVDDDGPLHRIRLEVRAGGQVILQAPLGDAAGYWNPGLSSDRGLPADWKGVDHFSAIRSAPLGALYDADGTSRLAFGLDWILGEGELQFGVSEEEKNFVVRLPIDERIARRASTLDLVVAREQLPYPRAIRAVADALYAGSPGRPVSPAALEPVYSTWYAYSQRISEEIIGRDLPVAAELGFRSVFIDDGWQRFGDGRWYAGCGDWVPDTTKFPDLRAFVDRANGEGLDVVLWLAPLLIGEQSEAFGRLKEFATVYSDALRAWVLDPRHREVRDHLVEVCARLVRAYGLDGLKIDFLNVAMAYAGTPSRGDLDDVGFAMTELLRGVADAVDVVRPGALIEFRQPYVSPAVASYADVVRADDCPADADENRRSVLDLRLLAREQIVHADPIMWAPDAGVDAVSRQLFGGFFGVPQVSMPLADLSGQHRRTVAAGLAEWRSLREVLLGGSLELGLPSRGFPIAQARLDGTLVVVDYEASQVELRLSGVRELVVVNASRQSGVPYRVLDVEASGRVHGARLRMRRDGVEGEESIALEEQGFLPVPAWSIARVSFD